jgi:hypothetical protein
MKILTILLLLSLSLGAAEPVISKRGKLIYEEAFTESLSPLWMSKKGNWQVKNGRLIGQEPKGNDQPVHLSFSPEVQGNFIIEFEMRLKSSDAQAGILINPGEDCTIKAYLGRAILTDRSFATRLSKGGVLKKEKIKSSPTMKWFRLTLEVLEENIAIQFNNKEYKATNESLKKVKSKAVILLAGKTVEYKNLKIYEAIPK